MNSLPLILRRKSIHTPPFPDALEIWALPALPDGHSPRPREEQNRLPLDHPEARRQATRAAARELLRRRLAIALPCDESALALDDVRGQGVRVLYPEAHRHAFALSIAHADGVSLVALARCAALGVDVQQTPPAMARAELLQTAHDYLGPAIGTELQATGLDDAALRQAFTQAWATHEARLKTLGQPLTEWTPALAHALRGVSSQALPTQAFAPNGGCAAAVAWR
jgi:phosphopantetheinyl transferase